MKTNSPFGEACIYALMTNGKVRYVGSTINPASREKAHRASKGKHISKLMRENVVEFVILAQTSAFYRYEVEQSLMDFYRLRGQCDLQFMRPLGGKWPKPSKDLTDGSIVFEQVLEPVK